MAGKVTETLYGLHGTSIIESSHGPSTVSEKVRSLDGSCCRSSGLMTLGHEHSRKVVMGCKY